MYGDKAKIGLIVVSPDTTIEPEFNAMKPAGVSVHSTRILLTAGTVAAERKMLEGTEEAARLLASAGVDIIVFACTSGSSINGIAGDSELVSRIEKATSIPATTPTHAITNALRALQIGRLALLTPYNEELTLVIEKVLDDSGFKVVNRKFGSYGIKMGQVPPETVYRQVLAVNTAEAEAILISCTNFKTLSFIDKSEKELNKFVISSNTATMWEVLRRLNIRNPITGYGKLLVNTGFN